MSVAQARLLIAARPLSAPCNRAPKNMRSIRGKHDICIRLCVVVVEVIVRSRPSRVVGSVRHTRQSSIACVKSSRMPRLPVSVGVGPSGRPPAAVLAVTSPASPPPRIAMRARRPGTSKRPPNRGVVQPDQIEPNRCLAAAGLPRSFEADRKGSAHSDGFRVRLRRCPGMPRPDRLAPAMRTEPRST